MYKFVFCVITLIAHVCWRCITLLNDVGFHNMMVGCWELNLNPCLFVQPFENVVVIYLRVHKMRVEC